MLVLVIFVPQRLSGLKDWPHVRMQPQKATSHFPHVLLAQVAASDAERVFQQAEELYDQGSQSSIAKALPLYRLAIQQAETSGNRSLQARALNNLGRTLVAMGRARDALPYEEKARALYHSLGDELNEATCLTNMGDAYAQLGQYGTALDYLLKKALPLREKVGDTRGELFTLNSAGVAYSDIGNYQKAIENYQKARACAHTVKDVVGEAATLDNIAFAHYRLHQDQLALAEFADALKSFRQENYIRGQLYALNNIAQVQRHLGRAREAMQSYEEALALTETVGDKKITGILLVNLGAAYIDQKESSKALSQLARALAISRASGNLDVEGRALGTLMFGYRDTNAHLAIFYGKKAVNLFQDIRNDISALSQAEQKLFLSSKEDIYRVLTDLLISDHRLPEAQEVMDLMKEQEFNEYVRGDAGTPERSKHLALNSQEEQAQEDYDELGIQITSIGRQYEELLEKKDRSADDEARLEQLYKVLISGQQQFQDFLEKLSSELGTSHAATEALYNIEEDQSLMSGLQDLGPHAIILYTLVLEHKYTVIVITSATRVAREYPIERSDLAKMVIQLRSVVEDPSKAPQATAKQLYDVMVSPVQKDLDGVHADTILWVLDGVLRYVPVSALYDGSHYMVERYSTVVFTPASRQYFRDKPQENWHGVGLGLSHGISGFADLPNVPKELHAIIRDDAHPDGIYPGKVFLDTEFTQRSMLSELRQGYQLAHIASHFKFRSENQDESYLLLGDGERFTVSQLKIMPNIFRGLDLLTLSACNTAVGAEGSDGREVEGFGVLAQREGAKSVLATLWNVADASTTLLMGNFYGLRAGPPTLPKAEALRRAQIALLTGNSQSQGISFRHPRYWAPFILIGNPR